MWWNRKSQRDRDRDLEISRSSDLIVSGARTLGHILEISNGYIVVLRGAESVSSETIYVQNLEKLGEVLAALKAKHRFLNEPQVSHSKINMR